MSSFLVFLSAVFCAATALAQSVENHIFTPEQNAYMAEQNIRATEKIINEGLFTDPSNPLTFELITTSKARPFAEFERAGYLIFSSQVSFQSRKAKQMMAKELPPETILVVFTYSDNATHIQNVRDEYSQWLDADRLKVVYLPTARNGFWARDGVPVPVWREDKKSGDFFFSVVDAKYYHEFEADQEIGDLFSAKVTKHDYFFEGGNFMANSKNECIIVDKTATQEIPSFIFQDFYGCDKLLRLPHVKGIGHADESIKFVDDKTVLTDEPSYVGELEYAGYTVHELPRPWGRFETYVNSLLVNGVLYVPIFGQPTDKEALEVYQKLGFDKVIGIDSTILSNNGAGSLHCITMTYPDVPFHQLLEAFGGIEL
ncbi:MAG: agmatine deiminase family protein [Bdellovibrionales bacterium]|nr:agmatine deiminase family protein [Bdellovibrionales bacterium]